MIISSLFQLNTLSKQQLAKLLGEEAGAVHSVNIVARTLPEDGRRVLWVSRSGEIQAGVYRMKAQRVETGKNLDLRTTTAFHFWIDVDNPHAFSHRVSKIKTGVMDHADPIVSQVQAVFFDLFCRIVQYLGPNNCPPANRKILLIDNQCAHHIGYYRPHADETAAIFLPDNSTRHSLSEYIMWADLQLEGLEEILRVARPCQAESFTG